MTLDHFSKPTPLGYPNGVGSYSLIKLHSLIYTPWVIRVPIETENQLINQMMAFLEGGSLDEALALLESVPADSLIVGMCRIFGDLYWIFGNNNKAKSSFKFGLALGPREPSLSVRIARFEARSGDSDSAMYTPRR